MNATSAKRYLVVAALNPAVPAPPSPGPARWDHSLPQGEDINKKFPSFPTGKRAGGEGFAIGGAEAALFFPNRGYALLVIMMMAVILLISLSAALPSIYTAGQRAREEELVFRGNEYARAIAFFHRRFNRYPISVEELLRTNGIRFLRRAYQDPMSRTGKWRFIHANAFGALLDSRASPQPSGQAGPRGPAGGDSKGLTSAPSGDKGNPSTMLGDANQTKGAFIIGVASSSARASIRVWNGHTHYDDWEFLGTEVNPAATQPASPGQSGQQGAPAQPGTPSLPGSMQPAMPSPTGSSFLRQ